MQMYDSATANRYSPPFGASNVDDLSSVGIDHFRNLEDVAGPVDGSGGEGTTPGGELVPNIDVQVEGRTFAAFGGDVFAIAAGATSITTSRGLATGVSNAGSLKSDDLTGRPKEDAPASGFVYVDISKVDRGRVGERWRVTENIDQVDGADRGIFGAPFPDDRPDYSQVVFVNSGRPALTGLDPVDAGTALCSAVMDAAAWSNIQPHATALFTILKRVL